MALVVSYIAIVPMEDASLFAPFHIVSRPRLDAVTAIVIPETRLWQLLCEIVRHHLQQ